MAEPILKHCEVEGCDYTAEKAQNLSQHVWHKHRPHVKQYKCEYKDCVYETYLRQSMTLHLRVHTGEKPYKCLEDGCNYAGKQQAHLQVHQKSHHKPSGAVEESPPEDVDFTTYMGRVSEISDELEHTSDALISVKDAVLYGDYDLDSAHGMRTLKEDIAESINELNRLLASL